MRPSDKISRNADDEAHCLFSCAHLYNAHRKSTLAGILDEARDTFSLHHISSAPDTHL